MSDPAATPPAAPAPSNIGNEDLVYRLSFSSERIKRIEEDDFDLTSKEQITLKIDDCILILFYVENEESRQLARIWALAARQTAGPVFASVNMITEEKVARAFTRIRGDGAHPLHWAALRQYPFILVYRGGYPVAVYNGPREVQDIIDYSLTKACDAKYYEPVQLGGGMEVDQRLGMANYNRYVDTPGNKRVKETSLDYGSDSIRGFDPRTQPTVTAFQTPTTTTTVTSTEEAPAAPAVNETSVDTSAPTVPSNAPQVALPVS